MTRAAELPTAPLHLRNSDTAPAVRRPIGIVCARYAPYAGGVESHVQRLATGLVTRGIQIEVLSTSGKVDRHEVEQVDRVCVHRFPTVSPLDSLYLAPSLVQWLWRHADRYALLHAHSFHTLFPLGVAIVARRKGVPFVVTPHYHRGGHTRSARLLHIPYAPLGRWAMEAADHLVAVTGAERSLIAQDLKPGIQVATFPNGVDAADIAGAQPFHLPAGEFVILAGGRLERYKQVHRVVEAMAHLPLNYRLIIFGDGPARRHLALMAERLLPTGRVTLLGQVSGGELARWYRTAHVYITLSTAEAQGIGVLEAAAGGAPIVASNIPAHREVESWLAPATISLVNPNVSPDAIANALRTAIGKGRQMHPPSGLPTWEAMVDGVLDVYQQVLAGRGALHPPA